MEEQYVTPPKDYYAVNYVEPKESRLSKYKHALYFLSGLVMGIAVSNL